MLSSINFHFLPHPQQRVFRKTPLAVKNLVSSWKQTLIFLRSWWHMWESLAKLEIYESSLQPKPGGNNFTYRTRSSTTGTEGTWTGMDYHGNSNEKSHWRHSIHPAGRRHQRAAEACRSIAAQLPRKCNPLHTHALGSRLEDRLDTTHLLISSPAAAANRSCQSCCPRLPLAQELSWPRQGNLTEVCADWICLPSLDGSRHFLSLPY